eukprot:TRINITY_DN2294_c0_g1_i1.p1 TRINITY_DN2294_c0_g1~~TRINITY_DN2294_c0_g1_i1.p1  ORF type:complete len:390 (+),score=40.96 TRINITY_DN2294_c0_g1_i1:825-1994(+)
MTAERLYLSKIITKNESEFAQDLVQLVDNYMAGQQRKFQILEFVTFLFFTSPETVHATASYLQNAISVVQKLVTSLENHPDLHKIHITINKTSKSGKSVDEKISLAQATEKIIFYHLSHADLESYRIACPKIIDIISIKAVQCLKIYKTQYMNWLNSSLKVFLKDLSMNKQGNIHGGKVWEWKKQCKSKTLDKTPAESVKLVESLNAIEKGFEKSEMNGSELHFHWILLYLCGNGWRVLPELLMACSQNAGFFQASCNYLSNMNLYFPKLFLKFLRGNNELKKDQEKLLNIVHSLLDTFTKDPKWLKWLLVYVADIVEAILSTVNVDDAMHSAENTVDTLISDYEIVCHFLPKVKLEAPPKATNPVFGVEHKVLFLIYKGRQQGFGWSC